MVVGGERRGAGNGELGAVVFIVVVVGAAIVSFGTSGIRLLLDVVTALSLVLTERDGTSPKRGYVGEGISKECDLGLVAGRGEEDEREAGGATTEGRSLREITGEPLGDWEREGEGEAEGDWAIAATEGGGEA